MWTLSFLAACRSEPPAFDAREIDLGGQADPLWFESDDILMAYVRPTGEAMRIDLTTGDGQLVYPGAISVDAIGDTGDTLIVTNDGKVIRLAADGNATTLFVMDQSTPYSPSTGDVLVSDDGNIVVWNDYPTNNLHVRDVALGITQDLLVSSTIARDGHPWAMDGSGAEFVVEDADHMDVWSTIDTTSGDAVEVEAPNSPYDVVAAGSAFRFVSNYGFDDVGPDVVISTSSSEVLLEAEAEEGSLWYDFGGFTHDGNGVLMLEERSGCGSCKAGWLALVRYDVDEKRGRVLGAGSAIPRYDGVTYYATHPVAVDATGERLAIPSPNGLWLIAPM